MRISDICTQRVVSVTPDASIHEAARMMRQHHVGCLVVVDRANGDRAPVGLITDRDIVLAIVAPDVDPKVLTAGDAMTRDITTCGEDEELFDVLQTMRNVGVRRLPVVDARGRLAGIVTADDAIGALSWHLNELARALTHEQTREMEERI